MLSLSFIIVNLKCPYIQIYLYISAKYIFYQIFCLRAVGKHFLPYMQQLFQYVVLYG